MKTLLLLTDFSPTANHAVGYGYDFAKLLEAEVILCNVINVPAEIPQYETILLPFGNYDLIEEESIEELKRLKKHLEHHDHGKGFHPPVSYACKTGVMTDQIDNIVSKRHINLIIMGTHASSGLKHLLLGNHTRYLLDTAAVPLLLVSPKEKLTQIKWIAFATDLNTDEIPTINKLAKLASLLKAEIILMNICHEDPSREKDMQQQQFLSLVKKECHYPMISCQSAVDKSIVKGLEKLCNNSGKDGLLSVIHKNRNFINEILLGSQTQKLAKRLVLPLLVLPPNIN
ncbi:universal stress protein [Pedobacter foliorum]|uniref:universal stress protein n=1 Tax=Pedobacter foliorum TaxID=2739058 RepID=UPI001564BC9F|nr:universal stress protein [Pedobacter foliorum]NRF37699.1 universal stress protein [Pedobacter foliorum]